MGPGFRYVNDALGPLYNSPNTSDELKDQIELGDFLLKQAARRRKEAAKSIGLPSPPRLTKSQIEAADKAKTAAMQAQNTAEIDALIAAGQPNGYPNTPFHMVSSQPNTAIGFPPGQEGMRPIVFDPRDATVPTRTTISHGTSESRDKAEQKWANYQAQRERLHARQLEREKRPKTKAEKEKIDKRARRLARQEVARDRKAGILQPGLLDALQQKAMETEIMRAKQQAWEDAQQQAAQQAAMAADAAQGPFPEPQPGPAAQPGLVGALQQAAGVGSTPQPYIQLAPGMQQGFASMPFLPQPAAPAMSPSSAAQLGSLSGVDPNVQVASIAADQQRQAADQQANNMRSQTGLVAALGGVANATGFAPNINDPTSMMPQMTPEERDKYKATRYEDHRKAIMGVLQKMQRNPNDQIARATLVSLIRQLVLEDPNNMTKLLAQIAANDAWNADRQSRALVEAQRAAFGGLPQVMQSMPQQGQPMPSPPQTPPPMPMRGGALGAGAH